MLQSTYQYSLRKANFNFIDERLTTAVDTILQHHPDYQSFNWSNHDQNLSIDSLTDRIHTYVDNLYLTTPQLTYDDALWNIHPVEAVGHLGPCAILLMILSLTLIGLITIWCYRNTLFKKCRPVFQVTNTPIIPQQVSTTREVLYINSPVQTQQAVQVPVEMNAPHPVVVVTDNRGSSSTDHQIGVNTPQLATAVPTTAEMNLTTVHPEHEWHRN